MGNPTNRIKHRQYTAFHTNSKLLYFKQTLQNEKIMYREAKFKDNGANQGQG
jgi:hypothetical protein